MSTKSLLVELFVEELPPKSLGRLGAAFGSVLVDSLREQGLCAKQGSVTTFATPRRLAVLVPDVAQRGEDKQVEIKLVPVKVGLDADGNATMPLKKKLAALGADETVVPSLVKKSDGKNETLWLERVEPGAELAAGLQTALDATIQKLPIPKVMTYQQADGWSNIKFVRPVHRLTALHGSDVVDVQALGVRFGNQTQGHRFEATSDVLTIREADSYDQQLAEEGAVIASYEARRNEIQQLERPMRPLPARFVPHMVNRGQESLAVAQPFQPTAARSRRVVGATSRWHSTEPIILDLQLFVEQRDLRIGPSEFGLTARCLAPAR